MAKISIKNQLLELGLSPNDAKVYLSLLNLGSSTADPIIKATNFHRNIVYTSLNHLITKKLVSEKTIKGKKYFTVTNPNILITEFEAKIKTAKQVADIISRKLTKEIQEITIHQGNDEYLTLLTSIINSMPKGSTKYVFGTGGQAFMDNTMWSIWDDYHEVAFAQKLKIKMISYESQRKALKFDPSSQKIYDIRYLSPKIKNPGGIHIYPPVNTVLNIIYSDATTPVTAIKIVNKSLTQGYLNLFNNLWKTGKK